jgi:hypothetical protein
MIDPKPEFATVQYTGKLKENNIPLKAWNAAQVSRQQRTSDFVCEICNQNINQCEIASVSCDLCKESWQYCKKCFIDESRTLGCTNGNCKNIGKAFSHKSLLAMVIYQQQK